MFCIKCGKELPENCRYCPNCGTAVDNGTINSGRNRGKSSDYSEGKEKLLTSELLLTLLLGISVSEFYYIVYYVFLKIQPPQTTAASFYLKLMLFITLSLTVSLKYLMPYLSKGFRQIRHPIQLRGVIGVSLGTSVALWRILSSMGQSLDRASTANSLLGESSFFITITILSFVSAKKKNTIKADMVSLLYLAGIYNWLFWLMVLISGICNCIIPDGILSLFALVILVLPLVIALIAGICFYRCKRR